MSKLREAAEYIMENGWHQGSLRGPDGKSACALGALQQVHNAQIVVDKNAEEYWADVQRLAIFLREEYGLFSPLASKIDPARVVFMFNDSEITSKEDVLLAMKKAAELD